MPEGFDEMEERKSKNSAHRGRARRAARDAKRDSGNQQSSEPIFALTHEPSIEQSPAAIAAPDEFDTQAAVANAKEVYVGLGKTLRKKRMHPERLHLEVWDTANEIFDRIKSLARKYEHETDGNKKNEIKRSVERLSRRLEHGVGSDIKEARKGFDNEILSDILLNVEEQKKQQAAPIAATDPTVSGDPMEQVGTEPDVVQPDQENDDIPIPDAFRHDDHDDPDTPLGWRMLLGSLIAGAKEKTVEKAKWWKSSEEELIRRSEELDRKAEEIGGLENLFRKMGEEYNKRGWKTKLAVGLGLGIGAGVAAPVNMGVAVALLSGVAVQRVAALSTMYLKFEKAQLEKLREKGETDTHRDGFLRWGAKEKAMAKAMLYTATMAGSASLAAHEISHTNVYQQTKEWLGHMMTSGAKTSINHSDAQATSAGHAAEAPQARSMSTNAPPTSATPPTEVPEPPATPAPTAEVASTEAAPTGLTPLPEGASDITVEAKAGQGYERMLNNLWKELHEKGVTAESFPEKSDMRALMEATDDASIKKAVHDIATGNEYFKDAGAEAGRSVRINIGDKMTFDAKGNIWINDETIVAEHDAPTTAPYHPTPPAPQEAVDQTPASTKIYGAPEGLEQTIHPASPTPEAPSAQGFNPPETMTDETSALDVIPQPKAVPETDLGFQTNRLGTPVQINAPHFYTSTGGETMVYGGTPKEQFKAVQEYLSTHPKESVLGTNNSDTVNKVRVRWSMVPDENGALHVGGMVEKPKGFFGNFLNSTMRPPTLDELKRIIK